MLELQNVTKSYDGKLIVAPLSYRLETGESLALTGQSGCGKTTVLRLMSGLEKPDSGKVLSSGGRYSFVFQENRLLPHCTCKENLTAVGVSAERAEEYLAKVGLADDAGKYPPQLSGGMKRRLSLARCLSYGGDVYFLDEPLRELDADTSKRMLRLIKEELQGKTAVIVTHSAEEASSLCTRELKAVGIPFEIIDC